VTDVTVTFPAADGRLTALERCGLDVAAGSFTAIIGPNGSGKSTLLRLVAGLLQPDSGSVALLDEHGPMPPTAGDSRIGLVFQQPRLLPWLTTLENVALPLALRRIPSGERGATAMDALGRVGLSHAAALSPHELSGGMAQRAALARALVTDPPLLLLDEPFSALDALSREAFDTELQRLWLEHRRTVLFVTHAVPEAIRLADRVAVMTAQPGAISRIVEVDLPRPRPVQPEMRALELEETVREALASVHPPELTPWTATP
jgi:NitT/TauT family transport system ATP-binding protein